ncbi:MAG: class I SAM-dependent methyltransferase [Myxococcota bacterium]
MTETDPYADAVLYDLEYADHVEDLAHYVDRARTARGPVLELGCGTGRLTVPIARAGVTITGIDRAPSMLAALARRAAAEAPSVRSRITAIEADYLAEDPPIEPPAGSAGWGAVLWPFNALHHCPDERALGETLTRIRRRLAPNGRLCLDCYLLDRSLYDRDPNGRYEQRTFVHPATGVTLDSWEQGWWDEAAKVHHVVYVYRWPDGTERSTHLQLRMFDLPVLRALLDQAGLRLARESEDFRGTALRPSSLKWVGVAEAR